MQLCTRLFGVPDGKERPVPSTRITFTTTFEAHRVFRVHNKLNDDLQARRQHGIDGCQGASIGHSRCVAISIGNEIVGELQRFSNDHVPLD